jgi:hypothetical protein
MWRGNGSEWPTGRKFKSPALALKLTRRERCRGVRGHKDVIQIEDIPHLSTRRQPCPGDEKVQKAAGLGGHLPMLTAL